MGFIQQAILRHVIQFAGASIISAGFWRADDSGTLTTLLTVLAGALISLGSGLSAAAKQRNSEILKDAVSLPEVNKEKTVIAVTDLNLAAKTPKEVVYDPQTSSD